MVIILFASLSLNGCGSKTTVETGSLIRSYKLIDDQGREAGTLTINPVGGAELHDIDGKVIGSFAPVGAASKQEVKKPAESSVGEKEKK